MSSWGATSFGHLLAARPRPSMNRQLRAGVEVPVGSRWYCRHQHAFSRYFRLSTRCNRDWGFGIRDSSKRCCLLSRIPNPSSRITAFSTTAKGRGLSPPASAGRPYRWRRKDRLLHFDRGTGRFQVLLELGSFFLRNAFLDRATAFGPVLGFLQAQAGDRADHLDDLHLLLAGGLQVDRELGLDRKR